MLISNTGFLMFLEHRYVLFYFLLSTLREREERKTGSKVRKRFRVFGQRGNLTRQAGLD